MEHDLSNYFRFGRVGLVAVLAFVVTGADLVTETFGATVVEDAANDGAADTNDNTMAPDSGMRRVKRMVGGLLVLNAGNGKTHYEPPN